MKQSVRFLSEKNQNSQAALDDEAVWIDAACSNPAAFEPAFGLSGVLDPSNPQSWTFGDMKPRTDTIRSPGFWNLDSSLMKEFHISEERYVEFRWDVFNALNHQNLGLPNTTFCLPPNPDGSVDLVHQDGCSFGRITGVQTDPRNMTFALKFVW